MTDNETIYNSTKLPSTTTERHLVPLVPVRDVVLFPTNEIVLTFGRKSSIAAINAALASSPRQIAVFTQHNLTTDNPEPSDLYSIGTLCSVERTLKNDDELNVLVKGLKRIKFLRLTASSPNNIAEVEVLSEVSLFDEELEALGRRVSALFKDAVGMGKSVEFMNFMRLMGGVSASELSDQIAAVLNVNTETKQKLLETLDLKVRLYAINDLLTKELKVLEIEKNIANKTQAKFSKHMKETVLRERLATIKAELGEDEDPEAQELEDMHDAIHKLKLPKKSLAKIHKEFSRLERMSTHNPESSYIRTWLETVLELPWNRATKDHVSVKAAERILNLDHHGLEEVKERILEYLAVMKLKKTVKKTSSLPTILCFVGPPGVGKTSLGRSIARALKREFVKVSLGGIRDEAEIRGHRKTYVGAMPGRIIDGIKSSGSINPVFMLDEIDKISSDYRGDPSAALLEALDPEQNHEFVDHYLEIPVDLSSVMFIATANVLDTIPSALRDRLEVIHFSSYTRTEKYHIAKTYLLPKVIEKNGLKAGSLKLSDSVLRAIISRYTREAGVRALERELSSLARKFARRLATGKKTLPVTLSNLSTFLGPAKYSETMAEKRHPVGMATGLAWTSVGGDILFIEVSLMPGSGKLQITGSLGDVMKESASAAYSYVRSHASALGIKPDFYKTLDIHIHVPEGAVPKDGPSAGVTLVTALVSALTKKRVNKSVGMTGEITLRGRVLEIGGLKEKVIAAHTAGLRTIIHPRDNTKDLVKIPSVIKKDLTFHAVDNIDDVLKLALNT